MKELPNSVLYALKNLRPIIIALMKEQGRAFDKCELCHKVTDKLDLHHTKYNGATYYDLQIVCRRCNTQQENRYLA